MKVKVQCPCGTRFEFEVEPVNERMPVAIACPACGADATGLADAVIRQQLPAAGTAVTTTPPAAPSGLRIARSAPAPADASPESADGQAEEFEPCNRHKTEPAVERCRACGKPICQKCLEQFGYVCSIFCREAAAHKKIPVPVYANQRGLVEARSQRQAKYLALGVAGLAAALIGAWVWYTWFARDPVVVYSLDLPKARTNAKAVFRPEDYYELIAPNRLITIKSKQISLLDVTKQSQIWSAPLETGPAGFDGEYDSGGLHVTTTSNDVWVSFPGGLARFDRQTGKRTDPAIPGKIRDVVAGDEMFLVISQNDQGLESLTRITLPDGEPQSETVTAPPTNTTAKSPAGGPVKKPAAPNLTGPKPGMAEKLKGLALTAQAGAPPDETTVDQPALFEGPENAYMAAGRSAVEFKTRLLERKTIERQAMKKPKGKSVLDGNITASQGMDLAEEMMNDSQRERTGGVEIEDVSRYLVTLHRQFAKDVPDWTGEVTGPAELVPLKTVDLLLAGTNLYAIGRDNKKLWDAKLTFPAASRLYFQGGRYPCLETKDALYFADKGMLTRFDPATGAVRWRLTSVGISAIQVDDRGGLYVDTTTAAPETIQFSQQVNLHEKDLRVIMRVDPDSGKILWRSDFPGSYYHVIPAGKFLYSERLWQTQDALKLEEGPDDHFNLKLISPGDGKMIWNYPVAYKRLIRAEVQQNWILLHFEDQVMVLKFFSL